MGKEYFLGLDIGTGSVGWVVTDENYQLLKSHGKALWGVRLFETANTAEERRIHRINRRRLARRNWRIDLLQTMFQDEINKVDDGFYLRMKESRYTADDKLDASGNKPVLPYALFVDAAYTDKDYHKQFPTIYHLRQYLMTTEDTPDIRLVYLALHHMMKHRGHFLFSGSMEQIKEFKSTFQELMDTVQVEELDFHLDLAEYEFTIIEELLKNRELGIADKKKKLCTALNAKTKCEKALLQLLAGSKVKLSHIFSDDTLDDSEAAAISFSEAGYDDKVGVLEATLGEKYPIIAQAKAVYDWAVLTDVLGDAASLSEAKIAVYEKHKYDLAVLKKAVREQLERDDYRSVFVDTKKELSNYVAYIGMTKKNGKKCVLEGKACTKDDFYKFIKKNVIDKLPDGADKEYLSREIEQGTFLPKQVVKDNGVIPHQLHLEELKRIVQNLGSRVPLLAEQGETLEQLFTFRIPYYVGPLNGITRKGEPTNWVVRNSNDTITPWNFNDVVDVEASAEKFIRRMTNKCTYLNQEDVLPKYSLLYSKFEVLNELNNLKINGQPIDVSLKQKIYVELFQRYRKVTIKKLKDFLKREGIVSKNDTVDIAGIDIDFKSSLTAYHDFKEKLTGCTLSDNEKEDIIKDITLFADDKKLLKQRLAKSYPQLTDKQIGTLSTLSYKGWGRLSAAFLSGITAPAPETGEKWTIINAMWEINENLMQVLSNRYLFMEAVEKHNGTNDKQDISYQLVDELYVSPAVKRQIWQTLLIVKELCHVLGQPPKRVFIEMARGEEEQKKGKRTVSRKAKLQDLYKACKAETPELLASLDAKNEADLRSDKLYLYYTQKGRCMYTGEAIHLEELFDNRKYDIDHIYPQSKTMDDSLKNRVLVKKEVNAEKDNNYPLKTEIREKMRGFWKSLLDGGFIEKEKYDRLTRATPFKPEELTGFIARQLVETRQSTKAVASILQQVLPDSKLVYVKASIASQFRQDFDLIKVRDMNDLHHAKDAYLNIVTGNAYYTKFTENAAWYVKQYSGNYNLKKMFTSGYDITRNEKIAWKAGEDGTIKTVKSVMRKNNILVTRRNYEVKGELFDQQLMKKGSGQVPIKGSDSRLQDINKYGGYNKASGSYFMLVQSKDKKGKPMRTIEYVPLYLCKQLETSTEEALRYLTEERELTEPQIILPKIKIDTLFKVDGFYMWLSGRTGQQLIFKGANQLLLSKKETMTLKKVLKFVQRRKENAALQIVSHDGLTQEDTLQLYDCFLDKLENTVYKIRLNAQVKTMKEKRNKFIQLAIEEQCQVLSELLHLFQCQSGAANLNLIGGSARAGIITLGMNITDCKQISIINQSPTGIFEQEIDLLKL